ncbi:MAG: hypothetical protein K6U11_06415 [bacterium]|nr:hypothetical protein [bacterium]
MKIVAESSEVKTTVSTEPSPLRDRLIKIKQGLDEKLGRYNPGELLSWWIAEDAFELPDETISKLSLAGGALKRFFQAANTLFYRHSWIQKRLEKKFSPHYRLLNLAQIEAIPIMPRPDVILDRRWQPKFVELEITVGSRADTAIMAEEYGLAHNRRAGLVKSYAEFIKTHWPGKNLALVTAPHPFFQDLPDDAKAFASMLRREGLSVVVLGSENLPYLRFDGQRLLLCRQQRATQGLPIHLIDRFIDIYEIAELQHAGLAAILDAYLAGVLVDVNTCKQFLDEKDWMALFWEEDMRDCWRRELGEEYEQMLRDLIPKTFSISREQKVELPGGERVPILKLGDIPADERQFVIKESGTSTTASGAQSLLVLPEMSGREVRDLIERLLSSRVSYIIQEIVDSPRISFTALDPYDDRLITQHGARIKLSAFYCDGKLIEIRFVASNAKLAVNDQDYVVGVVRY